MYTNANACARTHRATRSSAKAYVERICVLVIYVSIDRYVHKHIMHILTDFQVHNFNTSNLPHQLIHSEFSLFLSNTRRNTRRDYYSEKEKLSACKIAIFHPQPHTKTISPHLYYTTNSRKTSQIYRFSM